MKRRVYRRSIRPSYYFQQRHSGLRRRQAGGMDYEETRRQAFYIAEELLKNEIRNIVDAIGEELTFQDVQPGVNVPEILAEIRVEIGNVIFNLGGY